MTTRELVTIEEHKAVPQRVLLSPTSTPARVGPTFQCLCDGRDLVAVLRDASLSPYVAIDFETKGNDYTAPGFEIVGIGLAWHTGSAYFHWPMLSPGQQRAIKQFLLSHQGLIAHNAYFDGGVIRALFEKHAHWAACTLALFMFLSNEGWIGQQWGLKEAMKDILLWENTNEVSKDEWLVANGFYKGNRRKDNSPETLLVAYRAGELRPDNAEMWRTPAPILGKYCVLDAEACYLLFTKHLLPVSLKFERFHQEFFPQFMRLIELHIDQKMHGLLVDREALLTRKDALTGDSTRRVQQLISHPELEPHIRAIETTLLAELAAVEPPRYLKQKQRPPEPPRITKAGTQSLNWERWIENGPKYLEAVQSKNWENWQERWQQAVSGQNSDYRFNFQSGDQMRALLYDKLGNPVRVTTDSGLPGTGIKALKTMGDVGKQLIEMAWAEKELGFVNDYIERTEERLTIHPSFRLPGTKTGRLSSKGPNLQQVPKTKAMMSLFRARPGNVLVDLDFSALEPVVATEFSQDQNMLQIYGDGKPLNDVYLFVGAHIPGMQEKIRGAGYDPYNPTMDGLAAAKKLCKHERSICKTVVLACIAEGTPIHVRGKGMVAIEDIRSGDQVWDGLSWVSTTGAIDKGKRLCIQLEGTFLTPDHKVLGDDYRWRDASEYKIPQGPGANKPLRPGKPSASWADIRALVRRFLSRRNQG